MGPRSRIPGLCLRAGVFLLIVFVAASAFAASLETGQAEYSISWNGIPAGAATVDVRSHMDGGQSAYRVEALARTSWLVDLLWRFRGTAASTFTSDGMTPLGYHYDRLENTKHIVTDVRFNPPAGATGTRRRDASKEVIELREPGVIDPITAIFRALVQPVHVGEVMRSEVFTGEARYRVELAVEGEDVVSVAAGTYRAWRIEPRVWKIGTGADTRLRHATIWVSQDASHIPVRIRSEVFIGAVNCDLQRLGVSSAKAS